jgi:hypothetical protein
VAAELPLEPADLAVARVDGDHVVEGVLRVRPVRRGPVQLELRSRRGLALRRSRDDDTRHGDRKNEHGQTSHHFFRMFSPYSHSPAAGGRAPSLGRPALCRNTM